MSVLRNLAWIRNDLSVTMTDAFASDASVWNARVTCYVVLEKRDRAIKLHKVFGAPRKLWRPSEKVRWGAMAPLAPPARPPLLQIQMLIGQQCGEQQNCSPMAKGSGTARGKPVAKRA